MDAFSFVCAGFGLALAYDRGVPGKGLIHWSVWLVLGLANLTVGTVLKLHAF
jgi:hypothetical protein